MKMLKALLGSLLLSAAVLPAMAQTDFTAGEVRKVDKDNGKLTLKHDEIRACKCRA